MNTYTAGTVQDQSRFCLNLMKRLNVDVNELRPNDYGTDVLYKTRMQNDIVRLRRELLTLSKMLDHTIF